MQKFPPKYRYPLYDKWDKDCYKLIVKLSRQKQTPKILGTKEEINEFLKLLIQSQKMDDWRKFFRIVLKSISLKQIDVPKILKQEFQIPKGYERWVVFREDREVSDFLDKFSKKRLQFIGSNKEIVEFILKFILAQLLLDWKSSLYALKETIGRNSKIKLKSLNNVLSEFDYTHVFR
jgi:hypothetical protein